jgi:hypothetical protein
VPAELKDLSVDEGEQLVAYAMEKFAVANEKAVLIVNDCLALVSASVKLIKDIRA